jgi:hypothetical protein
MKVTLRPLGSFLGCIDLKTGVLLALFFALLNKVSGVYGLVAALTGAGGSAAQLSLYVYSTAGLVALLWALRAVTDVRASAPLPHAAHADARPRPQEDAKRTLYFAHLFFADHVLSSAWTVFFALVWWAYTPHDGARAANSPAQQQLAKTAPPGVGGHMSDTERAARARAIWDREKNHAAALIAAGWLAKVRCICAFYGRGLTGASSTLRS